EAIDRLLTYGPNTVAHEARKSAARRLLELFFTPLSILLLVLATVSYLTGETKGAVVIAIMVVLATLLSFIQEYRSSKAAERLRAMVSTTATVLRMDPRKGVPDEVNRHFEVNLRPQGVPVEQGGRAPAGDGQHHGYGAQNGSPQRRAGRGEPPLRGQPPPPG